MNTRVLFAFAAIVTMVAYTGAAWASPITVYNSSFQSNVVGDGGEYGYGTNTPARGWETVYPGTVETETVETYNPTAADFPGAGGNGYLPSPADNSQALFNASSTDNDVAVLTRWTGGNKTTVTLDPGMQYTWTVAIGKALTSWSQGPGDWGGFCLLGVDATAGNLLTDSEYTGQTPSGTFAAQPEGTFQDYTLTFNADDFINDGDHNSGDTLTFGFVLGCQVYADNARLDESPVPVPEPSSLALLSAGVIGMLAYAWRKRK